MSKEKIQVSIYYIDTSLFDETTKDDVIKQIIDAHHAKPDEKERFSEQQLKANVASENFKVRIFYSEKTRTPKWKEFLEPILDSDQDLLRANNHDSSYIAFISDEANLFAISGGQGNFVIQDYIDQNFGIRLLSYLISKDSEVIKSLQDRGLTGSVLASTRFFRGDAKLADEDEFGRIYKQIKAELKKEILSKQFGFTSDEINGNVGCVAKSSFQINKSIDFSRLLQILANITRVLREPSLVALNQVRVISRRGEKNKRLIESLENTLFSQLYRNFLGNCHEVDFDFCNPDFEKYLTATGYQVFKKYSSDSLFDKPFDKMEDVQLLFKSLEGLKGKDTFKASTFDEFKSGLANLRIKSFNTDNIVLTQDFFIKHVHGEIKFEEKTYFHIDGQWCEIQSSFIESLNTDCKAVIVESLDQNILHKVWANSEQTDETSYIQEFLNDANFFVLHKILAENVELCDLLKFDDSNLALIHIKKGFNNSIRDLTSQIMIAAKRFIGDVKGNSFNYLGQIHESLQAKSASENPYLQKISTQAGSFSCDDFLGLFKSKGRKPIFVLAFVDTAQNERDILKDDIGQFNSNIAKFSIVELRRNLRRLGIDLKITQIKRA